MTMKLNPYLIFNGNTKEVITYSHRVFADQFKTTIPDEMQEFSAAESCTGKKNYDELTDYFSALFKSVEVTSFMAIQACKDTFSTLNAEKA